MDYGANERGGLLFLKHCFTILSGLRDVIEYNEPIQQ